ncbi:MAG: hypothetical protein D6835_06795 [Candidatus Thermofonsia bacterium]|nr:MAG: hypothetical protein D6835_06795 [Candidatus Thermofonsia bacterium]
MTTANTLTRRELFLLEQFAADILNESDSQEVNLILERLITGRLSDRQAEQVMAIIGENDACMDALDALWLQMPIGAAIADVPNLDEETAVRLQRRLVHQLHRSNLTGEMFKLGTKGFLTVAASLLRPLIHRRKKSSKRRKR